MYTPLHLYSEYSFLLGAAKLERAFKRAKEEGCKYLGISDKDVMMGYPLFDKLAKKYEINPIYGMDFDIEDLSFSAIIKNEEGYRNLSILSTLLSAGPITFDKLYEHKEGLYIFVLSSSKLFEVINNDLRDKLAIVAKNFNFGDFYIGLDFYDKKDNVHYKMIREFAEKFSYKTIAHPLIRYIEKEDAIVVELLKAIKDQTKLERTLEVNDSFYHFREEKEIKEIYTSNEIEEINKLIKTISFKLIAPRGEMLHFVKDGEKSEDVLKNEIYKGLKLRNIDLEKQPDYRARLNHEFLTIKKMGYCDYFLIVQDYVNYAKNNNIPVGPGRGSAAGSLVAYLLNITDVDPIKYDLLFERFLNMERKSMPDIDIDFGDIERDRVFAYLKQKYGQEKAAHIATIQKIGARQALRDIGRIYEIQSSDISFLTKLIIEKSNKAVTLEQAYEMFPSFKKEIDSDSNFQLLFERAKLIEGLGRQRGLHAAGIVLNNKNLIGSIPLLIDPIYGLVTQYEKDYLEDEGFLKMDILGIINLTTIERCVALVKEKQNIDIDIKKIDLNDPKIYDLINKNLTMGLFQIDTDAAQSAMKSFVPQNFLQLVDLISLDRPGPRDNLPAFSRRLKGQERITYIDPSVKPCLEETYGIMIYQEQIMKVSQAFAGFTAGEADLLRKACAKKKKEEMDKLKDKFIQGAIKNKHSKQIAEQLFAEIEKFKDYGFPKAHSVSYTMITAIMGYLKAYYPTEFYAAILEAEYSKNDTKFAKFVNEIKKCNVDLSLPDINLSTDIFDIFDGKLVMPLTSINNIQSQLVQTILAEREANGKFTDFLDFIVRMYRRDDPISDIQISKLIDAGCFDSLNPNRKCLKLSTLAAIRYATSVRYEEGQLFNDFNATFEYAETEDDLDARIENEFEAIGVMISDSPLNHIKEKIGDIEITEIDSLIENKTTNIAGNIVSLKTIQTKTKKAMSFITLRDNSGEIDVTVFSDKHEENIEIINNLRKKDIVVINGSLKKNYKNGEFSFVLNEIKNLG